MSWETLLLLSTNYLGLTTFWRRIKRDDRIEPDV